MGDVVSLHPAPAAEPVTSSPITTDASTIRELIDSGRYPKDDAGRSIVPLRMGSFATITSTTLDGPKCIGGVLGQDEQPTAWRADGRWYTDDGPPAMLDLMPPGYVAEEAARTVDPDRCPGHIASTHDAKVCARCGIHIDELRPLDDEEAGQ